MLTKDGLILCALGVGFAVGAATYKFGVDLLLASIVGSAALTLLRFKFYKRED